MLEGLTRELGKPTADLVVETTLDRRLQQVAERVVARAPAGPAGLEVRGGPARPQRCRPGDGRRAELRTSPYNRVVTARRQPGSAFKPFVFLTALDEGWQPTSAIRDAPIRIKDWQPANNDGRFHGSVSLSQALALSLNSAAVRLGQEVGAGGGGGGPPTGSASTPRCRPWPRCRWAPPRSSPLELTHAYLPFATGGLRRPRMGGVSGARQGRP